MKSKIRFPGEDIRSICNRAEKNYRKVALLSTLSTCIWILVIILNVIANLDKIVWLANYVLSCLHGNV